MLEYLAKFEDRRLEVQIERLTAILRPLRKTRNLFIHGSWDLSPELLNQRKVAVTNSVVQYEENETDGTRSKSWYRSRRQILTYDKLREFEVDVMRAIKVATEVLPSPQHLYAEARSTVKLPVAQRPQPSQDLINHYGIRRTRLQRTK